MRKNFGYKLCERAVERIPLVDRGLGSGIKENLKGLARHPTAEPFKCAHRLTGEVGTLSRCKYGFESRWVYQMPMWWNGRHAGLRNQCREACRFKSCYRHHFFVRINLHTHLLISRNGGMVDTSHSKCDAKACGFKSHFRYQRRTQQFILKEYF